MGRGSVRVEGLRMFLRGWVERYPLELPTSNYRGEETPRVFDVDMESGFVMFCASLPPPVPLSRCIERTG